MCPQASGAGAKYAYLDHDTDIVDEAPPILNQWYTVFDAKDVRLIWCYISQENDVVDPKLIEVRWTIDGNVYFIQQNTIPGQDYYIYRSQIPSTGGTGGLEADNIPLNAAFYVDKRGQSFKIEVRIISALGINQTLRCYCVRETLEQT